MLNYISTGIIVLFSGIATYFYSQMPPQMIVHWNFYGQADKYAGKFCGLFTLPILTLAIFLLAFFVSRYSSHKKKIKKFINYYDGFVLGLVLFLNYFFILVFLNNFGLSVNMNHFGAIGVGLFIFYVGVMVLNIKHSWICGDSEKKVLTEGQWNKVSFLSGILLMISGGISILGSWWPKQAWYFVLLSLSLSVFITVVYSHLLLKQKKKN